MSKKLEFFYDYVSAYSYLADTRLEHLVNADVVYRPMFLGGVMEATGNRPPGSIEAKRLYLHDDIRRWAERYAVPWQMNPVFPQNTVKALRLALVAEKRGEFRRLHRPLFDGMWVREQDLGDERTLAGIVAAAGLDAAHYMAAIGESAIKDELKCNTREAIARGAFGAPTFFVDDEMYFGNDRFEFILAALER